ncbi:MAG: hypothetical protein Q8L56_15050 [Rhodocyclaceae bacterium]|nr:hypothetical protein [Rhodocyclaceae bacterium]
MTRRVYLDTCCIIYLLEDVPGLGSRMRAHLATAIRHSCTEFWTNDDRLNNAAASMTMSILRVSP